MYYVVDADVTVSARERIVHGKKCSNLGIGLVLQPFCRDEFQRIEPVPEVFGAIPHLPYVRFIQQAMEHRLEVLIARADRRLAIWQFAATTTQPMRPSNAKVPSERRGTVATKEIDPSTSRF